MVLMKKNQNYCAKKKKLIISEKKDRYGNAIILSNFKII